MSNLFGQYIISFVTEGEDRMRTLGNILWFILGGWWNFLLYASLGVLFCITIIGIPVGKALFQYAKLMALPFGKSSGVMSSEK